MSNPFYGVLQKAHFIVILLISAAFATPVTAQEPPITYTTQPSGFSPIRVFDREGRFVGRILPEKRFWTSIEKIPLFLQNALVAVEDSRFYEHSGIDVRGIARALVKDVAKGRMAEGGSTITQQLIKNKYLSGEKSLDRKITEGFMAVEFEKNYTKKQILEMYFNEIYYGNGAWGIAQAARIYFDKYPEELTEGECAILAGVPKNPGRYNPLGDPAKVNTRRDVVLKRMVDLKMITEAQKKQLRNQQVKYTIQSQTPQYLALIRSRLIERFGKDIIDLGGLDVAAAMDLRLQKIAEDAVRAGTKKISPELQGSLLSLDTSSGDILAFVGGVDFSKSAYNRAMNARRQPGSSIKPLIYAAAIDKGITAASVWSDAPVTYSSGGGAGWTPLNYGGEQLGSITLRQALAHSNNVITVKLLENIGIPYFSEFTAKAGLNLKNANDLSLALGTEEVTLQEMVQAYTPFANGGLRAEARAIIRVFDRSKKTNSAEYPSVITPAISPESAFVTTSILKDVMTYGTAKSLKKFSAMYPSAGKTGTTNDYRDAWFIGYTPQVVTGVWVGYDKPKPGGRGFTGGAVAAPIWEKFMRGVVSGRPVGDFIEPEGVVQLSIDATNGTLANSGCSKIVEEFFVAGTEPQTKCDKHGGEPLNPELEEIDLLQEEQGSAPSRENSNGVSEDL